MLSKGDLPFLMQAGLKTNFMTGMKSAEAGGALIYKEATTEIPSNKGQETYAWLGESPKLRKWTAERAPKKLRENGFTIVNEKWEGSISVSEDALEDDQYGQIKIRAQELGANVPSGLEEQFETILEAGTSTVCYDGQYFFDTDHSEGDSGTQVNYYNGAGYAFGVTGIKALWTKMRNFKDDRGRPAGYRPTHIVVPSGLEWEAEQIFNPTVALGSTTVADRVLSGKLKVLVGDFLTNNGTLANSAYYLLDLRRVVKPFIYQNRRAPRWTALDKPDSQAMWERGEAYYGVDLRYAFGYGDWRGAVRGGNT